MKSMTFSQHEKREQTIVYASNMSMEGVQKPTKRGSENSEIYRKTEREKKRNNMLFTNPLCSSGAGIRLHSRQGVFPRAVYYFLRPLRF